MITCITGGKLNHMQDKGNGKTATMTFFLLISKYPEAKLNLNKVISLGKKRNIKVITNYKCKLADEILNMKQMYELFKKDELKNCIIAIDELQVFFDSHYGIKKSSIAEMLMRLVQQSRKRNIEIFYTTQRYENIHLVIRTHTNYVYEPIKFHYDKSLCLNDKCFKPHFIKVVSLQFMKTFTFPLNPILKLYDSSYLVLE